jgi:excisionase family DNA binding protein
MSNDYMSRLAAAQYLDVHPRTIDRAIADGRLTRHTRGTGYYVYLDRTQVEQFKKQATQVVAVAK